MPKYAVLGATGQTGSELVKFLSTRTDVHLHIYARSQSRLDEKLPDINLDRCTTFVGSIEDTDLISNCIRSTDAVFAVVATNVNQPKCYVARQTADSIIKALKVLSNESENTFVCPTIVFLSSSSFNPIVSAKIPRIGRWLLNQAQFYAYQDMKLALNHLRTYEDIKIPLIEAQPGMLIVDSARGVGTGYESSSDMVSYADLARGMVQMVEEQDGKKYIGQAVPVYSTAEKGQIQANPLGPVFQYLLPGLLCSWFPRLWSLGRRFGWWSQ